MRIALAAGPAVLASVLAAVLSVGAHAQTESRDTLPPRPKVENPFAADDDKPDALARKADFAEAMQTVAERQRVFGEFPTRFSLRGEFAQGGLVFGQAEPGAVARLDGEEVMVSENGEFVVGFGRDSALTALLVVTFSDGVVERYALELEDREFPVQRIDGLGEVRLQEL